MSALGTASDLSGAAWQYGYEVTQGGEVVFDVFSGEVRLGLREGREGLQSYRSTDDARQAWPEQEDDGFEYRLKRTESPEREFTTWHFNGQGRVEQVDYPFGQSRRARPGLIARLVRLDGPPAYFAEPGAESHAHL